ncbi:unnamed protein product [Rhizophagus irregularis]|nr:unnamed protein product [Rhizophagus irregularis]
MFNVLRYTIILMMNRIYSSLICTVIKFAEKFVIELSRSELELVFVKLEVMSSQILGFGKKIRIYKRRMKIFL